MNELFRYDRLTPSRAEKIAGLIVDGDVAQEFAWAVLERVAALIPRSGLVSCDRLEEVFLIAVETKKIFNMARADIWKFFEKPSQRTLLGHVFISAVDGSSLNSILQKVEFSMVVDEHGRRLFDAGKFLERRHTDQAEHLPPTSVLGAA